MAALAAASLGLEGCVGLVAVVRGTGTWSAEAPRLSTQRGPFEPTAENLRTFLGEPDRVTALGPGREQWHYRTGIRWHGVALLLGIVPLPLLVPTGANEAVVWIEDGRAVRAEGRANATRLRVGCLWAPGLAVATREGCFVEGYTPPIPELRRRGAALWSPPRPPPTAAPGRRSPEEVPR